MHLGTKVLQPIDLEYFLVLDGDEYPLTASLTIGRHLDNDVVVAGEDVLDFHLRIEPTDRGPRVHPLGEATVTLNGSDKDHPVGLVAGDVLRVGQHDITFRCQPKRASEAEEWLLLSDAGDATYRIAGTLNVGRAEDNEIMLIDDHVSRHHAIFRLEDGTVWLQDLGSANGTFVNGERIAGGCRLYHGDQVAFDVVGFQLVGKGGDLTDVRPRRRAVSGEDEPTRAPLKLAASGPSETTEIAVVDDAAPLVVPPTEETGAFLLGASEPVSGLTFRTRIGRTVIGRGPGCDVVIPDPTVSARHAEIMVRPESCTVTNLLATNGTRVNGEMVQSAELKDGDVLRIGRVQLVFKDVPPQAGERRWIKQAQRILLGVTLLLALGLVWLLL